MTFKTPMFCIAVSLSAQIVAATSAHAADPLGGAGMQSAPRGVVPMMQGETLPTFGGVDFGRRGDAAYTLG
jgi:hypothetical protein